jgi:hypothetical protein
LHVEHIVIASRPDSESKDMPAEPELSTVIARFSIAFRVALPLLGETGTQKIILERT